MVNYKIFYGQTVKLRQKEVIYFMFEILVKHFTFYNLSCIEITLTNQPLLSLSQAWQGEHLPATRPSTPEMASLYCKSSTEIAICVCWSFFFFFPKPCRSGYVLYKSLPLGLVIQKFYRSPPVSCKFGFFFFLGGGLQICIYIYIYI